MPAQIFKVAYDFSHASASILLNFPDSPGSLAKRSVILPAMEGIEEINYTPSIEREKMYGSSRLPQGRTDGIADFEASITMLMYWWRYIIDVANDLGAGLATLELDIAYTLYRGTDVPIHSDTLRSCAIKSPESAFKRGPENMMVPVALDPMNIFYDGFDVFGNPLT